MDNWQKCPICNGEGEIQSSQTSSVRSVCPTCKGGRIIDLMGFPPQWAGTKKELIEGMAEKEYKLCYTDPLMKNK